MVPRKGIDFPFFVGIESTPNVEPERLRTIPLYLPNTSQQLFMSSKQEGLLSQMGFVNTLVSTNNNESNKYMICIFIDQKIYIYTY